MKTRILIIFISITFSELMSQNFTHSGYVYSANGSGAVSVPINLYKRTTPVISGFTQQTNYNGHSYYRSTRSETWTTAKQQCENMGGHLATVSSSGENNFLYNTWPSGWIGLYQDKNGAFYSEPNGGWRWTENYVGDYSHEFNSLNYTTSRPLPDSKDGKHATLYNGPTYSSSGGKFIQFDGSNDYAITGDLSGSFPNGSKLITLQLLCYPEDPGVLVSEFGQGNANSGWHESVMEITSNGVLRVGFWNGSSISSIGTSISMNTWHLISITYDGSSLRGYLDGSYFGIINFGRDVPHAYSGNGLYYCFGKNDQTNMGDGTFAKYRFGSFDVYNRVLSLDEIDRNWMSISYRYGRIKYTNWNSGEPNHWSNIEDHVQFVSSGRWNDLSSSNSLPYVIEFDYIVDYTKWELESTVYTGSDGFFSFNLSSDPSKQYYLEIEAPVVKQSLSLSDAQDLGKIILSNRSRDGIDFHSFDLNSDNRITISDQYLLFSRKSGVIKSWNGFSDASLFSVSEYNFIKSQKSNLRSSYPGKSLYTSGILTSGGTITYYLIAPGFSGSVTY
jgi:hypothetical protein